MMGWEQSCAYVDQLGAGGMWGGGMGLLGPVLGLLFILGFLALLVVGAIWLARRTRTSMSMSTTGLPAKLW